MRSGQLIRVIMARVEGSGDGDSDRGDQQFIAKPIIRLKLAAAQRSISIWTQKKWQVAGFLIGWKARMSFGNFVCLTFQARPLHRLAIVTAAENHFLAANDNHDIANRRIRITPDRNFRRSIFAGHRNIFFARKPDTGAEMSRLPTKRPQGSAEAGIVYFTLCHSYGSARHNKPPPRISFQAECPNLPKIGENIRPRRPYSRLT